MGCTCKLPDRAGHEYCVHIVCNAVNIVYIIFTYSCMHQSYTLCMHGYAIHSRTSFRLHVMLLVNSEHMPAQFCAPCVAVLVLVAHCC